MTAPNYNEDGFLIDLQEMIEAKEYEEIAEVIGSLSFAEQRNKMLSAQGLRMFGEVVDSRDPELIRAVLFSVERDLQDKLERSLATPASIFARELGNSGRSEIIRDIISQEENDLRIIMSVPDNEDGPPIEQVDPLFTRRMRQDDRQNFPIDNAHLIFAEQVDDNNLDAINRMLGAMRPEERISFLSSENVTAIFSEAHNSGNVEIVQTICDRLTNPDQRRFLMDNRFDENTACEFLLTYGRPAVVAEVLNDPDFDAREGILSDEGREGFKVAATNAKAEVVNIALNALASQEDRVSLLRNEDDANHSPFSEMIENVLNPNLMPMVRAMLHPLNQQSRPDFILSDVGRLGFRSLVDKGATEPVKFMLESLNKDQKQALMNSNEGRQAIESTNGSNDRQEMRKILVTAQNPNPETEQPAAKRVKPNERAK